MTRMTSGELDRHDHDICGRVWIGRHAREMPDSICADFGPPPCGWRAIRGAGERTGGMLKAIDAQDVHAEAVDLLAWQSGPCEVQVRSGQTSRAIDGIQQVHSAAAAAGGPVVDAGAALPEELERLGRKIEGAILLMRE